jgi:hypothetical protein
MRAVTRWVLALGTIAIAGVILAVSLSEAPSPVRVFAIALVGGLIALAAFYARPEVLPRFTRAAGACIFVACVIYAALTAVPAVRHELGWRGRSSPASGEAIFALMVVGVPAGRLAFRGRKAG